MAVDDGAADKSTPHFGVSQPISTAPPDERDIELTAQLDRCFRSFNLFETEDEMQKRIEVLRKINALVKQWVKTVSIDKVYIYLSIEIHLLIDSCRCNRYSWWKIVHIWFIPTWRSYTR